MSFRILIIFISLSPPQPCIKIMPWQFNFNLLGNLSSLHVSADTQSYNPVLPHTTIRLQESEQQQRTNNSITILCPVNCRVMVYRISDTVMDLLFSAGMWPLITYRCGSPPTQSEINVASSTEKQTFLIIIPWSRGICPGLTFKAKIL